MRAGGYFTPPICARSRFLKFSPMMVILSVVSNSAALFFS